MNLPGPAPRSLARAGRPIVGLLAFAALITVGAPARADRPYVVIRDDGTIASTKVTTAGDLDVITQAVLAGYMATGAILPEILSVWTTFPIGGDSVGTYFVPVGSEVTGIGLEQAYAAPFPSSNPPLVSMLIHNDFTRIPQRASAAGAPSDGYASYLFLLELAHTWGPAIRIPGKSPTELQGFPVHWSFFLDAGTSPAGGNKWHDNGDGTFSTEPQTPADVRYSMLDLYLMGLAGPMEVPPFGVLESPVLQGESANVVDGLWGGPLAAHSFPWFGADPIVVKADRRVLTIDDVTATNGARMPAFAAAQKSWRLGIVLVIGKNTTDGAAAQIEAQFDPIASSFAPVFSTATDGRGALEVVTGGPPPVDAGIVDPPPPPPDAAMSAPDQSSGGCSTGRSPKGGGIAPLALLLALVGAHRRSRRCSDV